MTAVSKGVDLKTTARWTTATIALGLVCVSAAVSWTAARPQPLLAQASEARRAANLAMLAAYPGFYHLQPVALVGSLSRSPDGTLYLGDAERRLHVLYEGPVPDATAEVRGAFWDLGRMNPDDPRLARYDVLRVFGIDPNGAWPLPGRVTVLVASAVERAEPPPADTIRALVLEPSKHLGAHIDVIGQFAGRNLLGDLPEAPSRSRYDFVLRAGGAAIWVANLRPRGRDFELSLDTRIDTGRWVEVSGTLQQARGLLYIDAAGSRVELRAAPRDTGVGRSVVAPALPPPEIIFSAPLPDAADVPAATAVKIQFSRDMKAPTLEGRVRVVYGTGDPGSAGTDAIAAPIAFTQRYVPAMNLLELQFAAPLESRRRIRIDLLDGIQAADSQPLASWSLTFTTR